jgi:serine/threonine protein kinase
VASEFHLRVQRVLEAALRVPPDRRAAAIQRACEQDTDLLREVLSLLPHYEQTHEYEPDRGPEWFLPGTTTIGKTQDEAAAGAEEVDPEPPFHIDQYRCERILGGGGMGVVYLAQHTSLRRFFAVKLLRSGILSPENRWRFAFEAELLRRLQHPGIAGIFETSEVRTARGTRPSLVMEYIEGLPLARFAAEKGLNALDRLALFARVCEAVEHAHRRGVIHRDLKPGNILVDDAGRPHVLDFGIARLAEFESAPAGESGGFFGTREYASPEQMAGKNDELTPASDVYSLGLVLHQLLTGRLPQRAEKALQLDSRAVRLANCTRRVAACPKEFRSLLHMILSRALAQSPTERCDSAGRLGAAVGALLSDFDKTSRWTALRGKLSRLLAAHGAASGDATSRSLSAVLRTRMKLSMERDAADKMKPERTEPPSSGDEEDDDVYRVRDPEL